MSYAKPKFRHPEQKRNAVGFVKSDYEGALSTLCAGCGHDSISAAIVQACYELSIEPHKLAKLSGIGCSSKTPTYFLGNSHGFNSVHGRMPSITTGASLANRDLIYLGVSGDGDTASIGLGQFCHVVRRNLNMTYVVMNNGCYGLTKGQDSATADYGSINKSGAENLFPAIDLAELAITLGATFVGRSFSGDKTQLIPLLKAAISHQGFAFLDIISPCVTFNNNKGSTKSYDYVRQHIEATSALDFVPEEKEIVVSYPEGSSASITLHDGSVLGLQKLNREWDPTDRNASVNQMQKAKGEGKVLTGLLYVDPAGRDLHSVMDTVHQPLNSLTQESLCPGNSKLEAINASFR
jgi:2-oxoglutarate ferredoxin oxidoreductase subunit beta